MSDAYQLIRPMDGARLAVLGAVGEGDHVVDATAGNGYDTAFLAGLVGPEGRVDAFDIQENALNATRKRLQKEGLDDGRVQLHLASHAQMAAYVSAPVGAVMFNLGYLPGSDKSCVTRADGTLEALSAAAGLLRMGGIMTVMCYSGHPGGAEETGAVSDWLATLPIGEWLVLNITQANGRADAPSLFIVHKGK